MKNLKVSADTAKLISLMGSVNEVFNQVCDIVSEDDAEYINLETSYKAFYDAIGTLAMKNIQQNLCIGNGEEI